MDDLREFFWRSWIRNSNGRTSFPVGIRAWSGQVERSRKEPSGAEWSRQRDWRGGWEGHISGSTPCSNRWKKLAQVVHYTVAFDNLCTEIRFDLQIDSQESLSQITEQLLPMLFFTNPFNDFIPPSSYFFLAKQVSCGYTIQWQVKTGFYVPTSSMWRLISLTFCLYPDMKMGKYVPQSRVHSLCWLMICLKKSLQIISKKIPNISN